MIPKREFKHPDKWRCKDGIEFRQRNSNNGNTVVPTGSIQCKLDH
jgi:hypothetical protein